MKYADFTRNTKEPLKRLAHSGRLQKAAELVAISPEMRVLDYGCGDGGFFDSLVRFTPKSNLFGFDPILLNEMTFEGATTYDDASVLLKEQAGTFDVVYCMEVCEHLSREANLELFSNIRASARDNATFVFGVPLESGLSGFLKNIYRYFRGRRQNATLGRAIKSLFGLSIPRAFSPEGWTGSHIGFESQAFQELLKYGGFEIVRTAYLPWPFLKGIFNNEVYFVCRRDERGFDEANQTSDIGRSGKGFPRNARIGRS